MRTTVADRSVPLTPDLVGRDFTASALDLRWCGDITYLPVGGDWMYLATVVDLHSRRVVGWSFAEHMRADLVVDAVQAAVAARGGDVRGVVFHSDHGAQYTSEAFALRAAEDRNFVVAGRDRLGWGWRLFSRVAEDRNILPRKRWARAGLWRSPSGASEDRNFQDWSTRTRPCWGWRSLSEAAEDRNVRRWPVSWCLNLEGRTMHALPSPPQTVQRADTMQATGNHARCR
ncbi:DDE-type integrase/transposase/recombinase [Kitasatospora purpeofusca]|uniref:DDE-type integrase/transposase/recombinase n=1 Tax=Kitasatospora purpeofusca TaxID=67352 RepID=UPI0036D43126